MRGRIAKVTPTKRSIQYVVRLGGACRGQLEAVQDYENERRGSSLSIADVLREVIAAAAAERGLVPHESDSSPEGGGLRVELRRRTSGRKTKTAR